MKSYLSHSKFPPAKNTISQSPKRKKKLLELALDSHKVDKSVHEIVSKSTQELPSSNSTKTKNFESEIERRFQHSLPNQAYSFPRKLSHSTSHNSSLDSLVDVTEYNLYSQNNKSAMPADLQVKTCYDEDVEKRHHTDEGSQQQAYTARDFYKDSENMNNQREYFKNRNTVREDYFKIGEIMNDNNQRKLKMGTSKSQRNIRRHNVKQNDLLRSQTDNSNKSHDIEIQADKVLEANKTPKVINLNVNVNMNINYNEAAAAVVNKHESPLYPLLNANCYINCNFLSKSQNLKDLNIKITKSSENMANVQKSAEFKPRETEPPSKSNKNNTPSSASTNDKSLASFKSSYSIVPSNIEKQGNQIKVQTRKQPKQDDKDKENQQGRSNLMSPRLIDSLLSPKGINKFFNKSQKKAQNESLKNDSLYYNSTYNLASGPLTARVNDNHKQTSNKLPSPKLNNFLYFASSNLKTLGEKMAQTDDYTLKPLKNRYKEEHVDNVCDKEIKENTARSKVVEKQSILERKVNKTERANTHRQKIDKSKLKLNLRTIEQNSGAFSDRMRISSDRSEKANNNKSNTEYFI